MGLNDFEGKHIIVNLKDGEVVEGILVEIKDVDDEINSIYYTTLNIRVDTDNYRVIYINEIDTIGEVK